VGVDTDGALVVIELKNEAAEGQLDQGLRYYDWCRQDIAWLATAHSGRVKVNPDLPPRLVLVAPSFTDSVKRIAKYIDDDVGLQLIEYHAFESETGERGAICTKIDFGERPEPLPIPTIDKMLEYFHDGKVRELFKAALAELQQLGAEARPIQGQWVTFWFRGKRFMRMGPKRNFFAVEVLSPGGDWLPRQRVATQKEWDTIRDEPVAKYLEYLKEGALGLSGCSAMATARPPDDIALVVAVTLVTEMTLVTLS
jgi:hypothetical protein